MRIIAVSDLHGDLKITDRAITQIRPDLMICCGDWGDAEELDTDAVKALLLRVAIVSTYGNHDALEELGELRNGDGTPILLAQGGCRLVRGLALAAIGGVWAKSHAKPFYVTDADVAECAARIAACGPVDILMTHGCPIGLADRTPSGRSGGQRCFLEANKTIEPRLHLCGHLHVPQERTMKDGRKVINVGATPEGSIVVIDFDPVSRALDARLERLESI